MKTCEYPTCKETELNTYKMCKKHEVNYGDGKAMRGRFKSKTIKDGFKRMASKAPRHIASRPEPEFAEYCSKKTVNSRTAELEKNVQQTLL